MKLKKSAIRMVASGGNRASLDRLDAVYESDPALRTAVIRAWIIGDRKDLLLRAAKGEQDPAIRRGRSKRWGRPTVARNDGAVRTRKEPEVLRDVIRDWPSPAPPMRWGRSRRRARHPRYGRRPSARWEPAGGADILLSCREQHDLRRASGGHSSDGDRRGGKQTQDAIASWYPAATRRSVAPSLTPSLLPTGSSSSLSSFAPRRTVDRSADCFGASWPWTRTSRSTCSSPDLSKEDR